MKTIIWGIIGAGTISTRFAKVLGGAEGMAVRAVYNRHIERAEALDMQVPAALRRAFAPVRQAVEALDFTQALTLGRDLLNQAPGG